MRFIKVVLIISLISDVYASVDSRIQKYTELEIIEGTFVADQDRVLLGNVMLTENSVVEALITEDMDFAIVYGKLSERVRNAVRSVSPDRYTLEFIQTVKAFVTKETYRWHGADPIGALGEIPSIGYTSDLLRAIQALITPNMNPVDHTGVIKALGRVYPKYYQAFIETALAFTKNVAQYDQVSVIEALSLLNFENYGESFVGRVHEVLARVGLTLEGIGSRCAPVMEAVGGVPSDQFASFLNVLEVVTPVQRHKLIPIDASVKVDAIKAALLIPFDLHNVFISFAQEVEFSKYVIPFGLWKRLSENKNSDLTPFQSIVLVWAEYKKQDIAWCKLG